jgi:conjugative transposon TraK protein
MFKSFQSIEKAFRSVRVLALSVVGCYTLIVGFVLWRGYHLVAGMQQRIYILYNGKVLDAVAADRKDNVGVEARDQVERFHELFFGLEPDDKLIHEHLSKALYLADGSALRVYEDLKEAGYFNNIVSANISQAVKVDSITLNLDQYPYPFRCFARERIVRATTVTMRTLVTKGFLRSVERSPNNSHGFLIERLEIVENKDVQTMNR